MKKIFIHGSGQKAESWRETISNMAGGTDILCPALPSLLGGKEASFQNLYASFAEYCNKIDGPIHLCGISLGGVLALNYALDYPQKVKTLVLIGTPHKIPKVMFAIQNFVFHFLPESSFAGMAFGKEDTFTLTNSMRDLDFQDCGKQVLCPTLIVCGKKDSANLKSAYFFSQQIKNAELHVMADTGHVVNEESPKALGSILTEFYAKHQG